MRISNIQVRRPVGDEEGALLSESLETRSSDCGVFNKVCGTWGRSLEAKLQYVRDVENWNIIFYDGGTSKNCLMFTWSRGMCIVLKVPQGVCTLVLLKSSPSYLLTSLPQRISFKERSCTFCLFFPQ